MSTKSKSKVKVKDLKPKKDAIGGRHAAAHAANRSAASGVGRGGAAGSGRGAAL